MTDKTKIVTIYSVVAVVSVVLVAFFIRLGSKVPGSDEPLAVDTGADKVGTFFPVTKDLELTRQDGKHVHFSDLRGKVSVVAQFFAVCPHCAVRNGAELKAIQEAFSDHPDFRIMCITVDPETDGLEELKAYGKALDADPEQWWFVTADDEKITHEYLEKELKFFEIRERKDEVDIASNGRFAHDLAFLVVDRDLNVIGKYPLADLRTDEGKRNFPDGYEKQKAEMFERLKEELGDE